MHTCTHPHPNHNLSQIPYMLMLHKKTKKHRLSSEFIAQAIAFNKWKLFTSRSLAHSQCLLVATVNHLHVIYWPVFTCIFSPPTSKQGPTSCTPPSQPPIVNCRSSVSRDATDKLLTYLTYLQLQTGLRCS